MFTIGKVHQEAKKPHMRRKSNDAMSMDVEDADCDTSLEGSPEKVIHPLFQPSTTYRFVPMTVFTSSRTPSSTPTSSTVMPSSTSIPTTAVPDTIGATKVHAAQPADAGQSAPISNQGSPEVAAGPGPSSSSVRRPTPPAPPAPEVSFTIGTSPRPKGHHGSAHRASPRALGKSGAHRSLETQSMEKDEEEEANTTTTPPLHMPQPPVQTLFAQNKVPQGAAQSNSANPGPSSFTTQQPTTPAVPFAYSSPADSGPQAASFPFANPTASAVPSQARSPVPHPPTEPPSPPRPFDFLARTTLQPPFSAQPAANAPASSPDGVASPGACLFAFTAGQSNRKGNSAVGRARSLKESRRKTHGGLHGKLSPGRSKASHTPDSSSPRHSEGWPSPRVPEPLGSESPATSTASGMSECDDEEDHFSPRCVPEEPLEHSERTDEESPHEPLLRPPCGVEEDTPLASSTNTESPSSQPIFTVGSSPTSKTGKWRSPHQRGKALRTFPGSTSPSPEKVSPPSKRMPPEDMSSPADHVQPVPQYIPAEDPAQQRASPPVTMLSKEQECQQRAEYYRELGNQAYKQGLYAEAVQQYTHSIEIFPNNPSYYGNRAACYWMMKRYTECLSDSMRATQLDPKYYKGYARAGRTYLHLGMLREAREQLSRAKLLNGTVPLDHDFRTLRDAEALEEEFEARMRWEEFHRALQKAKMLVAMLPESIRFKVMAMRAFLYIKPSFVLSEVRALKCSVLLEDKENLRELILLQAKAHFFLNACDDAIMVLSGAIRMNQGNETIRQMLYQVQQFEAEKQAANSSFQAGQFQVAYDQYTSLLASTLLRHNRVVLAVIRCNRAAAAKELGKYREALLDCSIAIDLNGAYVRAFVRRARICILLGDYAAAIRDFQQAQALDFSAEVQQELQDLKQSIHRRQQAEQERARQRQAAWEQMQNAKDYYTILGVARNATSAEIKKAYRAMALQHHPDKAAEADRGDAEKKFKEISEAYSTLSDDQKRREYDLKSTRYTVHADHWQTHEAAFQEHFADPYRQFFPGQRQYRRRWGWA